MTELALHETMIERAAKALQDGKSTREAIEAAFDGVPLNNYAIGTLLQDFDLVIVVKDLESRAAALIARREGDKPAVEGFETAGHHLTVNWDHKPSRFISGVQVSKINPPEDA